MINRFFKHRLWTVLTASLAVLFLVFLAAGLKNIRFQPGRPLPHAESIPFQVSVGNITEAIASIPIWKQVVLVGLIILLAIIVVALFPPEWRKKILKYFVRYALFVIALFFIVRYFHGLFPAFNLNGVGAPVNGAPASDASDLPVFTAPRISSTLLYLISLGVVLILAGIAILISRKWLQKSHLVKDPRSLQDLEQIARSSLADISAGKDWEDVIINCYASMSEAAGEQRGIFRQKNVTASEFVLRLVNAGLPEPAVLRLTRLFEAARYGARRGSPEEMAEAVACLGVVLQACKGNV